MYKDIDEIIAWLKICAIDERKVYDDGNCADDYEQLVEWLEELKFLRTTKETMYREIYGKGRADAINPIQKFIDDYDGAIIISENMGVINGQQLINELKEIVEQLKEQKND